MRRIGAKLLSTLIVLVMTVGLLPLGRVVYAYSEGDIPGTTGSGATESDPVVCDNFAEFKAAMENTEFRYVKLSGANEVIPSLSSYAAAIEQDKVKTLIIDGTNTFTAPLDGNNACLIWSSGDLVIKGTGKLKYEHGISGGHGAVIYQQYGTLKIQGGVTLEGYANGGTFGRALYIDGGTTVIDNGIFMGYSAFKYTDSSAPDIDAVIVNEGNVTINGGTFSSTKEASVPDAAKTYGLRVVNGTVKLSGGTFNGIDANSSAISGLSDLLNSGSAYKKSDNSAFDGTSVKETQERLVVVEDLIKIGTVDVTVTEPVAGQMPQDATANTANTTVSTTEWLLEGTKLLATDTFEAGKTYRVHVVVNSNSGYTFDSSPTVTFNGTTAGMVYLNGPTYINYYAEFTVPSSLGTAPTITTATLPNGKVGTAYNKSLAVTGDTPITWSLDSGSLPAGLTLGTDGSISGTPTTAGDYTFTVKATNSAGSDTKSYTVSISAADVTTYTISFDANSGSGTMADITVNEGEKLTLPDCTFTPPSTDKEFDKWDAGNPGEQVDISSDCVIRAIWKDKAVTPIAPTITTATLPNGKVGTTYNQTIEATGETPITWSLDSGSLPAGLTLGTDGSISGTPTNAGDYTFTVKATNAAGDATQSYTITIAPADAVTYTVTFDANGHGTAPSALTVTSGSTTSKPSDPTASGWTFGGWYQDATCSVAFDFATPITANITLYAKWTENSTDPGTVYYTVVSGANSTWTEGDLTITVKRSEADETCFSHFTGVKIDGADLVSGTDFTAVAGSTVVTIKESTLKNLSEGGHTITVVFDDGTVVTSVTLKAPSNSSNNNNKSAIPATGETLAPTLFVGIAFVAVAGALFAVILVQKKKRA